MKPNLSIPATGSREVDAKVRVIWQALFGWVVIGFIIASFSGCRGTQPENNVSVGAVLSVTLLLGCTALGAGALLGFLFGIPRTLQDSSAPAQPADGNSDGIRQVVNTNLEQISDWLTKILVGVGLTQVNSIWQGLKGLAKMFAPIMGHDGVVVIAIVPNFLIAGFFGGYLMTRLFLAGAIRDADSANASIRQKGTDAEKFTSAGEHEKAIGTLESALPEIKPDTPPELREQLYQQLLFNYLYESDGHEKAISHAQAYFKDPKNPPSAVVMAYLAMAYGQRYWKLEESGGSEKDKQDARDRALRAVQEALKIDRGIKPLLKMTWDPKDPAKSPGDDDLEVFFDDPEFKALLG